MLRSCDNLINFHYLDRRKKSPIYIYLFETNISIFVYRNNFQFTRESIQFSIREIRNEERSVVLGSRASLGWLQPVSGLSRPVSLRQRRAGGVGGRPAAENRVQRWKKRRSWLYVASSSRETMERNRTKKDTKKRAKLETRALRKVGGNRSRTSFSFDHRRIRPAICYRTIRATIFFPSSFLLDDPRAAILFIPAYPFDGTRNFYLSSWSFPTFLERFILGFSFLRNRNT